MRPLYMVDHCLALCVNIFKYMSIFGYECFNVLVSDSIERTHPTCHRHGQNGNSSSIDNCPKSVTSLVPPIYKSVHCVSPDACIHA